MVAEESPSYPGSMMPDTGLEFFTVFNYNPIEMLLMDETRHIRRVNQAVLDVIGFRKPGEPLRVATQVLQCLYSLTNSQGCSAAASCNECPRHQQLEALLADGKAHYRVEMTFDCPTSGGDCSCHYLSIVPLALENRRMSLICIEDFTEMKKAYQTEIRQQLERYNRLLKDNHSDYIEIAFDGRIIDLSPALIRQLGRDSGLSDRSLIPFLRSPETWEQLKRHLLIDKQVTDFSIDLIDQHGKQLTYLLNAVLQLQQQAIPDKIVGTIREKSSATSALHEKLHETQRLDNLQLLLTGLAHEFNNRLTTILSCSDMLMHNYDREETVLDMAFQIQVASHKAVEMLHKLGQYSQRHHRRQQLLNINDLLKMMQQLLTSLLPENIHLVLQTNSAQGIVEADSHEIEQVILSIVMNAQEAMPDGGIITIETDDLELTSGERGLTPSLESGDYVTVTIRDNGHGIPEHLINKVFDPFITTKSDIPGAGLGLTMAKMIIESVQGGIELNSRPGQGTTCRLFLPVNIRQSRPAADNLKNLMTRPGTGTILLVEDETNLLSLISTTLKRCGYTVLTAANGSEAIQQFQNHLADISLLISDVLLPDSRGPHLFQVFRSQKPDIKVLFITGHADSVLIGCDYPFDETNLLRKPFSLATFVNRLEFLMSQNPPPKGDV